MFVTRPAEGFPLQKRRTIVPVRPTVLTRRTTRATLADGTVRILQRPAPIRHHLQHLPTTLDGHILQRRTRIVHALLLCATRRGPTEDLLTVPDNPVIPTTRSFTPSLTPSLTSSLTRRTANHHNPPRAGRRLPTHPVRAEPVEAHRAPPRTSSPTRTHHAVRAELVYRDFPSRQAPCVSVNHWSSRFLAFVLLARVKGGRSPAKRTFDAGQQDPCCRPGRCGKLTHRPCQAVRSA